MKRLILLHQNALFEKSKLYFNVYSLNDFNFAENIEFGEDEGNCVYIFSQRTKHKDGGYSHKIFYCGKTTQPTKRFYEHHKSEQLNKTHPNCLSIHHCKNKKEMDDLEIELIELYQPIYNKQHATQATESEKD